MMLVSNGIIACISITRDQCPTWPKFPAAKGRGSHAAAVLARTLQNGASNVSTNNGMNLRIDTTENFNLMSTEC